MKRLPTLEAVAALAGVSRSTVSRVVNDSEHVAPEARAAVRHAIDQLGYVPNRAARSLVTRRADSFALVLGESDQTAFESPFFGLLMAGISDRLAAAGQTTVLLVGRAVLERDRAESYLRAGHVDGAVYASKRPGDDLPYRLHRSGFAVVLAGRSRNFPDIPSADVDHVSGVRSAMEHLIARGRQRIATVTGVPGMAASDDRLLGYRQGLEAAGIAIDEDLIEDGGFTRDGGRSAMAALLERRPDLDAVFVASDPMALGVMATLRSCGRRVPDDVAVVSFDGTYIASVTDPPLTTIWQPARALGTTLATMVMAKAAGEEVQSVVLPTVLIPGGST